jgi:uncharacterized repeat protein (TIGR02543 family)
MRAKRRPIQASLSRLLVALLIVVGFQATGFTETSPAQASDLPGSINLANVANGNSSLSTTLAEAPGSGDLTYEFWYKQTDSTGNQVIFSTQTASNSNDGFELRKNGGNVEAWSGGNYLGGSGIDYMNLNQWYHFVIMRVGPSNWIIYRNGNCRAYFSLSTTTSTKLTIGSDGQSSFRGKIANFRYAKSALYTDPKFSNFLKEEPRFTPPLTPHSATPETKVLLNTVQGANFALDTSASPNTFTLSASNPPTSSTETPLPIFAKFEPNGGSGSMANQVSSSTANLSTNSFTKSGSTFSGWNTLENGTGTPYANGASYAFTSSITLFAQWSPIANTVTFNSQNWISSTTTSTLTGSSSTLPTAPTWYGYNFKGWSETSTGAVVDVSTVTITGAKTFYAIWEQKSLAGLTGLPSPNVINPHATQAQTITSSLGDTSTSVKVPGGALPTTFQVKVYTLPDDSFADEKLGAGTYIISQVVAWADTATGTLGNIQDTAVGKPIEMTITSPDIKAGAKVYSVLGNSSTLLRTATQNGSVTVTFSEDPVIIVEAAPAVNSAPGGSSHDPVVIKPVVKPIKPVANTPKGINFAGFNPNSWVLTKAIKASIDRFFKKVASPTKVSCVGNTMGPKILKSYQQIAERRGEVVCDYIANNFAETAEIVISGVPTKFADTRYRRTRVGLSY